MIMRERAEGILDGIAIMRHAIKAKSCIIAIEDNKPEAITAMQIALAQHSDHIDTEIVIVPTRYPAGSEKQLIQVITKLQVPNNKLPIDIGIVMHNVGTAYAIGRAINHGEPLISRIVTITGQNVNKAGNLEVLLGSPIRDLLDFCEATTQNPSQLLLGGPMMGYHLTGCDLPITKTSNCILAGVENAVTEPMPMPCIRCGECATACPVSLLPQQIYWHARAKELEKTQEYNLFDCIECGCCSYVCPSEIPLVQYFRFAKTEIMNQEDEKKKSNVARIRHENRQNRQETEKREKDLRQQRRKATLASEHVDKETS
jgi:electron transport complex protein RnfC